MKLYEIPKNDRRVQLCICGKQPKTFKTSTQRYRTRLMFAFTALACIFVVVILGPILMLQGTPMTTKGWIAILLCAASIVFLAIRTYSLLQAGHSVKCTLRRLVVEQTK